MAEHMRPTTSAADFMPNSNDSDRNRLFSRYMKESSTVSKLQTIKTVAIENELKFKEKNLVHILKKNAG